MMLLEDLKKAKKNLFQFYIVCGDIEENQKIVKEFLIDNFNLDYSHFIFSKGDFLAISETRRIKKENSYLNSNLEKAKKIYFLAYKKISIESQNSLLKTFEEVGTNSHFFLFVSNKSFLLDTIKSRAIILEGKKKYDLELAKEFEKASFLEREKIIKKIDKKNIDIFYNSLEKILQEKKNIDLDFYKKFLFLKKYIFNSGSDLQKIKKLVIIAMTRKGFFYKIIILKNMLNYLKGVGKEFRNIKWPTTKTTIYYTIGVIFISFIFATFIWFSDMTFLDIVNKYILSK